MIATILAREEAAQPDSDSGTRGRAGIGRWMWLIQSLVSGLALGWMLNQRWGYSAGDFDHHVLSPVGMQWAKPEWFANDWTVANAPQPHWFFDVITYLGTRTDTLALIYFLYFAASMFAFGVATTLLARKWAPRFSWYAVLAVTALTAITPLYLLGSGAILWPVALPGVFGGMLLYLTASALLVNKNRLAAAVGVCVAIVHVQVGVIVVVLLGAVAAVTFWRRRKLEWALIAGTIATFAISVFELKLRPVAGNLSDFARICDDIIPFHCNSSVWPAKTIVGGLAVVALALLTFFYLRRDDRLRWLVVLVLPAAGLFAGLVADRFNLPVLGTLAQGTNVYRLAVIFIPFLAWGMLAPVFAELGPRRRWGLLGLVIVLWYFSLRTDEWGLTPSPIKAEHWQLLFLGGIVTACVATTVPALVKRPDRLRRIGMALITVGCVSSAYMGISNIWVRNFEPGLLERRPVLTAWGTRVEQTVPSGATIMFPPLLVDARMATKRAIVADCKYGPYGGEASKEYNQRMADLGGIEQCEGLKDNIGYVTLDADQLEATARKYGATYIGLLPLQGWQAYQLSQRGWTNVIAMPNLEDVPEKDRENYTFISLWKAPGAK